MMLPRWGTLLLYGRAEVTRKFFWPAIGVGTGPPSATYSTVVGVTAAIWGAKIA